MQIQFDGITTEDLDECVICLEGVESEILDGEYPLEVSEVPKIVTTCECKGHVHRHCIKKWTRQRPICPFCNEAAMYFDSSPTNSDSSDEEDRILVRQKCCSDPMLPAIYAIAVGLMIIIVIILHI